MKVLTCKEIPVLFSTPMVQAILAGRKTMTRRIVKGDLQLQDDEYLKMYVDDKGHLWVIRHWKSNDLPVLPQEAIKCPHGSPGDIVYVRETWFPAAITGNKVMIGYNVEDPKQTKEITTEKVDYYWKQMDKGRYIPSIHMPKEAARIWLEVTDVRVERLQDISEEDAKAEGVLAKQTELGPSYWDYETGYCNGLFTVQRAFQSLWQSINGHESWNANPWVWCVSFKVLSTTGKTNHLPHK